MDTDRQERIRRRAHSLWDSEGQPEGRHEEHWSRATREIDGEDQSGRMSDDLDPASLIQASDAQEVTGAGPALAAHSKDAQKRKTPRKSGSK